MQTTSVSQRIVGRRQLLAAGVGLAVGPTALTACTTAPGATDGAAGPAGLTLPTHRAHTAIKPDLPGTVTGVPDGFLSYPATPVSTTPPLSGIGAVTALLSSFAPVPKPATNNAYLRELNSQLGGDLQLQVVSASDYAAKLATTITGGTLPDLTEMPPNQPQMPQMLAAVAADLTEIVSGDGILDYPNLAALAPDMWRMTVFDNRIYGVPVARPQQVTLPLVRDDVFAELGLSTDPTSWEELLETSAALTDRSKNRFAYSLAPMNYLVGAAGGCTTWQFDGDTLLRLQETEPYRQALSWCTELFSKGYIHPNAFEANAASQGKLALVAGTVGIHQDGFSAWGSIARMLPAGQQETLAGFGVHGFAGATPTYAINAGTVNFTAIRKTDETRTKQLLQVLDHLSAPFGSAEFLFRKYGTATTHHTVEAGNPVLTELGADEITPVTEALDYHLADAPKVAYEGALTEITRRKHAFASAAEPYYTVDPLLGLYSETNAQKIATFNRTIADLQTGIIVGRNTAADLDEALKTWNAGDGGTIKAEFIAAKEKQ